VIVCPAAGCRSGAPPIGDVDATDLVEAIEVLRRPLPGSMAGLYNLRVPSSGGLKLSVVESNGQGRLTISEPFGAAVSMMAWGGLDGTLFFDLRRGCRVRGSDLSAMLGVGSLPAPQAVRLLAGRLPASDSDSVAARDDGRLEVTGENWSASVRLAREPWRVVAVHENVDSGGAGWSIELEDHSASVPGRVRVAGADRRRVELELVRLQWDTVDALPVLPAYELCRDGNDGDR
jgi:hypothetical protein